MIVKTPRHKQNKVFVVHGHDDTMRETVARYLEKLALKPIILHEQTAKGRTLIEKFEDHGHVGFAIVLLSPDDVGGADPSTLAPRARQNVIFEWGYFIGKLSRTRVLALKKGKIELPSDTVGLVWQHFDDHEGWKLKVARELQDAGYKIPWHKLPQS